MWLAVEFRILGPLRVVDDVGELPLGGPRPRALLLRLCLDPNRSVAADRLIDAVWDGRPSPGAAATLQTYVSQLRKVLGADRLATTSGGYALVADRGEFDRTIFEDALAGGRRALGAGEPFQAADQLEAALAVWQGPALADVAGAPWAAGEAARLEELRLVAEESLLDARLELGQHGEVAAAAEAAVLEHPLRERFWAQLMLALYRDGRQGDALRAYQRVRHQLGEELGIDPGLELQELEAAILRQDRALGRPPAPSAIDPPATLPTGVVTFLLTDLVGSTRLWEAAPAAMAEAVARHEELIEKAVEARQGVLLKRRGEGDSTFSVFQRASDAVGAALDVQAAMAGEWWPTPDPLTARVALHTGEAVERDGDYYGRPVNRAARLRAGARPGLVTLSQATSELVADGVPPGWILQQLGVQHLRDLDRPETVYVLQPGAPTQRRATAERVPLPRRLATVPALGFAGRAAERARLAAAFQEAAGGAGRVMLVAGEPGIGKTSLAAELGRATHASGATVLYGRCDDDTGIPYRPWVESLAHLVDHAPLPRLEALGSRVLTDVARLVPNLVDRVPGLASPIPGDPGADRWALFTGVTALLGAVTDTTPAVLVLDDLQWADKPSLLLLAHVVDALVSLPVFVVAIYRDSDVTAEHPLAEVLAALGREGGTQRMTLQGLDRGEVVSLVEGITGQQLDERGLGLVHAVHRDTDGNPFFTEALLRHLSETGAVYLDAGGRWVPAIDLDAAGLPDSVREVVGRRVDVLGAAARRVLTVAAVIGEEFDLETVAAALDDGEDEVVDVLDAAQSAALVSSVTPGRYSFAHGLVAHTLCSSLTPTRLARVHRQVAEAIELVDPSRTRAAELARHWAAAGSLPDRAKASGYARDAGDFAMRALAPDEAIRWYSQSLDLLNADADAERCDLLIRLGRAQRHVDDDAYSATLVAAARTAQRIGDPRRLARAALANTRGYSTLARAPIEEIEMLEAALAAIGTEDSRTRARLLATLASHAVIEYDAHRRTALCDEAVAVARRVGDPVVLVQVLNLSAFALWHPARLTELLADTGEALALAETIGDPGLIHWSAVWRMHALLEVGRLADAAALVDRMVQIAADSGQPALQWIRFAYPAILSLLHGDTDEADRLNALALSYERGGGGVAHHQFQPEMIIAWHRDRLAEHAESAMKQQSSYARFRRSASLPLTLLEAGRADEARRVLTDDLAVGPNPFTFTGDCWLWAEACARIGTVEEAEQIRAWLTPYRGLIASTASAWYGSCAHALAVLAAALGDIDEAIDCFAEAEEVNARIDAAFFVARTRVAYARALLQRGHPGDASRAKILLQLALSAATDRGYPGVARDAQTLLDSPTA